MEPQKLDYTVRRLGPDRIPDILRLEGLCFGYRWNADQFRRGLDAGVFHILGSVRGIGDELLAYLAYSIAADEMEILNLAVHPDLRRRGMGTTLIRAMLEHCGRKKVARGFLDVKASNTAAIDLYGKFGFKKIGVRRNYYPDTREDALLMRLDLPVNETTP